MPLADWTPNRVEIKIGSHSESAIFVRGLSLDDCRLIIQAHFDDLTRLQKLAADAGTSFGSMAFILDAINVAPDVCFDIIAIAADETDYAPIVRKMPAGAQVKMLQAIARLTLEDIGGPLGLKSVFDSLLPASQKLLPNPTIQ